MAPNSTPRTPARHRSSGTPTGLVPREAAEFEAGMFHKPTQPLLANTRQQSGNDPTAYRTHLLRVNIGWCNYIGGHAHDSSDERRQRADCKHRWTDDAVEQGGHSLTIKSYIIMHAPGRSFMPHLREVVPNENGGLRFRS